MKPNICPGSLCEIEGVGAVHLWGDPEKSLVILLHGFMQTGHSWKKIALLLAEDYYVVAPDLLGHGKTLFHQGDSLSLRSYVENLKRLIDALQQRNPASNAHFPRLQSAGENSSESRSVRGEEIIAASLPVFLVGYSLGGRIAASFAIQYPQMISALVLESAGLGPSNEEECEQRREKVNDMIVRLDASVATDPARPLNSFVDWWESIALFGSQKNLSQDARARIREERLANDPAALRANLDQAGQHTMPDLRPALVNLNKPLLYLVGESDAAYNKVARSLMRAWALDHREDHPFDHGSVQIDIVPGAGHNIHAERPEEFARIVTGFFAQSTGCPGCSL